MATVYASANTTWNGATWSAPWWTTAGGTTLCSGGTGNPAVGDILEANGHTITFTGSYTADTGTPPTTYLNTLAGGSFNCSTNGVQINAHCGLPAWTATSDILSITNAIGTTVTVVGNQYGAYGNCNAPLRYDGAGTLNVTGNQYGGSGNFSFGIWFSSTGTLNVTGNQYGRTNNNYCWAIRNNAAGTLNITGNQTGGAVGNTSFAVYNENAGIVTITGNQTGGATSSSAVYNQAGGTINITGNQTGATASSFGVENAAGGTINITGNQTGGTVAGSYGVKNESTGSIYINGTATASDQSAAICNEVLGAIYSGVSGVGSLIIVGNTYGNGSITGKTSQVGAINTTYGLAYFGSLKYGTYGQTPTSGPWLASGSGFQVSAPSTGGAGLINSGGLFLDSNLLSAGMATAGGTNTITLQYALGLDSYGVGCNISIVAGTGAGQSNIISGYVDSTKVVTTSRNWIVNPDNTSQYVINRQQAMWNVASVVAWGG